MAGGSNPPGRATDFRHLSATGKCLFAIFPIPFTAICQELEHLNEVLKVLTYPFIREDAGLAIFLFLESPHQKSYFFDVT